jgi:predicted CoA-binding protein
MMTGRVLTDRDDIAEIVQKARRIGVLGIKTDRQAAQPAFYVPEYLYDAGLSIVPIPVYFPDVQEILGQPVVRRVADVQGTLDILDVFRRAEDLPPHLPDIVQNPPKVVWLQSGIRNDAFAHALTEHGIDVVQDRCLMVEHRAARTRM